MSSSRKSSIHHNMMMRTANRSEYDDSLLRHNQRQENRLLLEIEQWEKAQRVVAKGLDKESQWFRQKLSLPSSNSPRASLPDRPRRTSTEVVGGAAGFHENRFIPDYQLARGRGPEVPANEWGAREYTPPPAQSSANEEEEPGVEKASGHAHRRSSRVKEEGEGGKKSRGGNKHGEHHRKSSHVHRKSSRHHGKGSREAEDEKRDPETGKGEGRAPDRKPSKDSDPAARAADRASESQPPTTPEPEHHQPPPTRNKNKKNTDIPPSTLPGPSPTSTKPEKPPPPPPQPTTAPPIPQDEDTPTANATTSEGEGGAVSPRVLKELTWDGRRRYANVWDTLSIPKHTSTVRQVRNRLQREFTTIPTSDNNNSRSYGKGCGAFSARKATRGSVHLT